MFKISYDNQVMWVLDLEGYEGATVLESDVPAPTDDEALAEREPDTVESVALDRLEMKADEECASYLLRMRRQISTMIVWNEVQALKRAQASNTIPADALERAKQFPFLMALVQETGKTLSQVANAVENRFWDRVRKIATVEAKMQVARDAVRAAATPLEKLTIVSSVDWTAP